MAKVAILVEKILTGVLYSLVALGFVLIFKASGVFNFAQGAMVLFAALTLVRLVPSWLPFCGRVRARRSSIMIALAFAIERLVLRPLVNQEASSCSWRRIGITFSSTVRPAVWGSDIYTLDLGIPKDPIFILESVFPAASWSTKLDSVAAAVAAASWSRCSPCSSSRPRSGRALRAVADDHQAAQSVGIPLNQIWVMVWSVAGIVALVAGIMWGGKLGVQFSISLVALKALPVLILGGFTSVPGAIVGGLIIGVGEKLAEVYLGPASCGGGIENWFAYVLALCSCWSGRRACSASASSSGSETDALPRSRPVQDDLRGRPGDLPDPPGPLRHRGAARCRLPRRAAASRSRVSVCRRS